MRYQSGKEFKIPALSRKQKYKSQDIIYYIEDFNYIKFHILLYRNALSASSRGTGILRKQKYKDYCCVLKYLRKNTRNAGCSQRENKIFASEHLRRLRLQPGLYREPRASRALTRENRPLLEYLYYKILFISQ